MRRRQPDAPKPKLKKRYIVLPLLLLSLALGSWFMYRQYQLETAPIIVNSAGTTRPYEIPNDEAKKFDYEPFAFELPVDWKQLKHSTVPYDLYSYQATLKNSENRYLDIYVDKLPTNMPVNRALAVRSQGNNLSHGQVSENCTSLLPASAVGGQSKQLAVPATWDGVGFLCENDKTTRNVIGTSSPGGVNKVTLKGASGTTHSFFFVYTDHNYTPDYNILYKMLDSFIVK